MSNPAPVTYEIRLKDQMTKALKRMGGSLQLVINRLRKGFRTALTTARKAMNAFLLRVVAASASIAAMGLALKAVAGTFIEAAMTAENVRAKFKTVFKEMSDEAAQMAEDMAGAFGRNETDIMSYMARLQDTFVPMGMARDQALEMTTAVVSLAHDLSAMNKEAGGVDAVMDSLSSALIGSHEAAYKFGIIINDVTLKNKLMEMGVKQVNGAYAEHDKAAARLQIMLESSGDSAGYLINNMDQASNQMESLKSQTKGLAEEMGQRLIARLQETMANMGGIDAVVDAVRVTFEFFTNVITEILIPTLANMLENFTKFVEAMGGVDATVTAVSETVSLLGKVFKLMWNTVKVVFKLFIQGIDTIIYIVKAAWNILKMLVAIIGLGLVKALEMAIRMYAKFGEAIDAVVIFVKDTAIGVFQALVKTIADLIETIGESLVALGSYDLVPSFIKDAGQAALDAAKGMREFSASQDDLKGGSTVFKDISEDLDAVADKLIPVQEQLKGYIADTYEDLKEISLEFAEQIVEDAPAINDLFRQIKEGASEIGTDYNALADKVNQALTQIGDIEITTPEQRDRIADLEAQLERLRAPLETAAAAEDNAAKSAVTLTDRFDQLGDAAMNFAKEKIPSMEESMTNIAEGAMSSFASGMTDALMSIVDGSASAGEAFRKFASQFLMDIARMIIQTLVFKAIRSAMGIPLADGGVVAGGLGEMTAFANGGVASGGLGRFVPVKGYATGGPIVNKPHVALIGEGQHNEAVVPLPDGRSIPVDMTGAPETQVSINIEAVDGASVDRMLFDRRDTLRSIISTAIAESRSFRGAVARA